MQASISLLKEHSLRITPCRVAVLNLFATGKQALSQPDLENALGNQFDRVTIYRTLSSFVKAGLLHAIAHGQEATKYAPCSEMCNHNHNHNQQHLHVHFKCNQCQQVSCLPNVGIPQVPLPAGYEAASFSFFIEGACNQCT